MAQKASAMLSNGCSTSRCQTSASAKRFKISSQSTSMPASAARSTNSVVWRSSVRVCVWLTQRISAVWVGCRMSFLCQLYNIKPEIFRITKSAIISTFAVCATIVLHCSSTAVEIVQQAQLSQRDRATLLVIDYFVKSPKITQEHSKRHC